MKIDPRSDSIALHYTGNEAGEPAISGVPARDLTHNDVARLVFVEHGEIRRAARQAAVDKLVDELAAGPYRKTASAVSRGTSKPKKAAPAAKPQPASPAPVPSTEPAEPSSGEQP